MKLYQYSLKTKKLVDTYDSISFVARKYTTANNQLFRSHKMYHLLPDDTVLFKERLGLDGINFVIKRENCKYLIRSRGDSRFFIENMDGEVIAQFQSIMACHLLTDMNIGNLYNRLNAETKDFGKDGLRYVYVKDIEKQTGENHTPISMLNNKSNNKGEK